MPAPLAIHHGSPTAFRISPTALALVVAAHVGAVLLLKVSQTLPSTPPRPPLMVEVIATKATTPPAPNLPDITPPKPRPVARQERVTRAQEVPVLAARPSAQEPVVNETKVVPPVPLPPIQTPPAPAQTSSVSQAMPVAAAASTLPTSPRFDADYLDNPKPVYPPLSRREREQGKVLLRVFVEASGAAGRVELATSSGFERLDKSALAAVSRWRFVPARQGSETVAAWVTVPIIFSLKE